MSKLLIVDDESWTRETVKALIDLDRLKISQLIEATNGEEAIGIIKTLKPDFILTDMKMPGVDGIRLLEALEKDYPDILVIVLSGYQDFVYTRQAIKSRVIEYLPKPVDELELNNALEKASLEKKKMDQQQGVYQLFSEHRPQLEMIKPFQRTISFSLKELNASQFTESIEQFLSKINKEINQYNTFACQLHQEFLLLLEETMKEHTVLDTDIGLDRKLLRFQQNRTMKDELNHQLTIGEQVISKIKEINKQKSKINLCHIKEYIDENSTSSKMSLDLVAKKYFVSKEYLTTIFKKEFGCNVTEYIISTRMETAKELITSTSLQYKTIGEMIGYEDVSYFYRVFKKYHGIAPGGIRED